MDPYERPLDQGCRLSLPRLPLKKEERGPAEGRSFYQWGALGEDPVMVEVIVHKLAPPLSPEEEQTLLRSDLDAVAKEPLAEGARFTFAPALETRGGNRDDVRRVSHLVEP